MVKKPRNCKKCDKIFTRPYSLKRHLNAYCKENIKEQEEILEEPQEEIKGAAYILLPFLGGAIFTLFISYKWNCYCNKIATKENNCVDNIKQICVDVKEYRNRKECGCSKAIECFCKK